MRWSLKRPKGNISSHFPETVLFKPSRYSPSNIDKSSSEPEEKRDNIMIFKVISTAK